MAAFKIKLAYKNWQEKNNEEKVYLARYFYLNLFMAINLCFAVVGIIANINTHY